MSNPHLLPQYQHELLAAIDPADGVVVIEPSPEERQAGHGLIVGVKRYEPEPHLALQSAAVFHAFSTGRPGCRAVSRAQLRS
jgi:hypothetical protein